jgi:hypothetical protein
VAFGVARRVVGAQALLLGLLLLELLTGAGATAEERGCVSFGWEGLRGGGGESGFILTYGVLVKEGIIFFVVCWW